MRRLSDATAKIAGKSFERKYIAIGRIVNNWSDIVGPKLADKAQPVKIHYRKQKNQPKPLATLEIATSSADATAMHYQKDLILERINQLFGEQWISAIRFVAIPSNAPIKPIKKRKAPLTSDQKKTLSDMVLSVEDEYMRDRLKQFGEHIITSERP
ncbi:MAG: DUF721 domain-containing protein [Alphaproteobacteria bacterium]|nr:DUF721 domain-containing protein [Alphaproteobacteria bacterium]